MKFFYDVNAESRAAIKRSGVQLRDAFEIGDFDTKLTLSWALKKCSEKKERFCARMARNGNVSNCLNFCRRKGVLGTKVLVEVLPSLVTSSV